MKPRTSLFLGSVVLFLAFTLATNPKLIWFLSAKDGNQKGRPSNSNISPGTNPIPAKSNLHRSSPNFRENPIVDSGWPSLLDFLPQRPEIAKVSFDSDKLPDTFQEECRFLASIWAQRLRLRRDKEAVLAKELRSRRIKNWQRASTKFTPVEVDGKTYVIGDAFLFKKELWPEHWIKEAWPLLLRYQQEANFRPEERRLTVFKERLQKGPMSQEELNEYFGESEETGETEEPFQIAGRFREDEVLFWAWVYPEFSEQLLTEIKKQTENH